MTENYNLFLIVSPLTSFILQPFLHLSFLPLFSHLSILLASFPLSKYLFISSQFHDYDMTTVMATSGYLPLFFLLTFFHPFSFPIALSLHSLIFPFPPHSLSFRHASIHLSLQPSMSSWPELWPAPDTFLLNFLNPSSLIPSLHSSILSTFLSSCCQSPSLPLSLTGFGVGPLLGCNSMIRQRWKA